MRVASWYHGTTGWKLIRESVFIGQTLANATKFRCAPTKSVQDIIGFRDIAGFISQMLLLCILPRLLPKIWRCSPSVRSMSCVRSAVSQVPGIISRLMLFSENINQRSKRNRQTDRITIWQYRAKHYRALRGKKNCDPPIHHILGSGVGWS